MAAVILKFVATILKGHFQEYILYEAHKFSRPYMGNYFAGANLVARMIARALRLRKILAIYRSFLEMMKSFYMIPRVMEITRNIAPGMLLYKATTGTAKAVRSASRGLLQFSRSVKLRKSFSRVSAGLWNFLFTVFTRISRFFYLAGALFERVAGRT
jgi:hypothetical protein